MVYVPANEPVPAKIPLRVPAQPLVNWLKLPGAVWDVNPETKHAEALIAACAVVANPSSVTAHAAAPKNRLSKIIRSSLS
jgi:hypothetical protein